jgi:hypothetical protein
MTNLSLPRRKIEGGWLRDPSFDVILVIGVLALALTSGLVVHVKPDLFWTVMFLDLWLLGYHHVISTFTKLLGTAEDRKKNHFLIYYLPPIVLAAVLTIGFTAGVWLIVTIYFFWQWYHYTRQSYGISIYYRRKSNHPVSENPIFSQAALWSIPISGVLYRCSQGWNEFLGLDIWMPSIPIEIVHLSLSISVLLIFYWMTTRVMAWINGTLPLGQTIFILSHFIIFYVGYLYIQDINVGWLVINIWHNAQYILFVWLFNTNKYRKEPTQDFNIISWSSQTGYVRTFIYFTFCLLVTILSYGVIQQTYNIVFVDMPEVMAMLYVITFQAVNFHHYVVDAYIWKSRIKKNQDVMNLKI